MTKLSLGQRKLNGNCWKSTCPDKTGLGTRKYIPLPPAHLLGKAVPLSSDCWNSIFRLVSLSVDMLHCTFQLSVTESDTNNPDLIPVMWGPYNLALATDWLHQPCRAVVTNCSRVQGLKQQADAQLQSYSVIWWKGKEDKENRQLRREKSGTRWKAKLTKSKKKKNFNTIRFLDFKIIIKPLSKGKHMVCCSQP